MGEQLSGHCPHCGSAASPDQRYCLSCGARIGAERDPLLERLLSSTGVGAAERPAQPPVAAGRPPVPPAGGLLALPSLTLPGPRTCALLVLAFLGFGVLMGSAARSSVQDQLVAARSPHLRLVLPASPAAQAKPATSGAGETSASPPESQSTPTPEPSATKKTAAAGETEKESESEKETASEKSAAKETEKKKSTAKGGTPLTALPPIRHVFLIVLGEQPYSSVFGPASTAPYIAKTLESKGELLVRYDAVAHEGLADSIALISGQGPTSETAADCATYAEIAPSTVSEHEQVLGSGCVYPSSTPTLASQLTKKGLTWRAYVQSIDEPGSTQPACAHPQLGAADPTSGAAPQPGAYSTARDPFVYFQSVISSPACASDVVGLSSLASDLTSASKTPNFLYISPDRCHDGSAEACSPGSPAGLAPTESFLKSVIAQITASKAYKESGLIVITSEQAPSSGAFEDSSSCCGQPSFPNLAAAAGSSPRGGGSVGALLISPYVKGATTTPEPFNHFALLRTIEDLFKLGHLGYAALPQVKSFEPSMFVSKAGG